MTDIGSKNLLCYGDNLDFLSDPLRFPNECVDLIYLDPPFNSQQSYNVLFREAAGTPEVAQIKAFEDTWTWDLAANKALTKVLTVWRHTEQPSTGPCSIPSVGVVLLGRMPTGTS